MKYILTALLLIVSIQAQAAILVFNPTTGSYSPKTTLAAVLADSSTANKTIVVTSALSAVQSNISSATVHSWPANRALKIEKGGSIANSTNFAIASSFSAGRDQAFKGTGNISFSNIDEVFPEWWYSGSGDWSTAITTALNTGIAVKLADVTYPISTTIHVTANNTQLLGSGKFGPIISNTATDGSNAFLYNADYIKISGVQILGNVSSGSGVVFSTSSAGYVGKHITINDVFLKYHGGHGVLWQDGGGTAYSSYINITDSWIASNELDGIHSGTDQTINTMTVSGCVVNGGVRFVANASNGIYIGKGQTLTVTGSSFQTFVYGINYGYEGASSGFSSRGNYFEQFTEAGINLGGVVSGRTVQGYSISADYYNLSALTNATEGAGIRISKGFGDIGGIAYLNYAAAKKIIVGLTGEITITSFNDTHMAYCTFAPSGTKVVYSGIGQTMPLSGTHITGWSETQKTANLYGTGTTNYYFTVPVKYNDYLSAIKVYFETDNADASATMTIYKQDKTGAAAGSVIITGGRVGQGVLSKDAAYRVATGYAVLVKLTVVDDGAGGSATYLHLPYATGTF